MCPSMLVYKLPLVIGNFCLIPICCISVGDIGEQLNGLNLPANPCGGLSGWRPPLPEHRYTLDTQVPKRLSTKAKPDGSRVSWNKAKKRHAAGAVNGDTNQGNKQSTWKKNKIN